MEVLRVLHYYTCHGGVSMNAILIYITIMALNVCVLHTKLNEKVSFVPSFQGILIFHLYGIIMFVKCAPILMEFCKGDQVCQSHALFCTKSLV